MNNTAFAGNTKACFHHYGDTLTRTKAEIVASRQPLADFVGVSPETAQNWFRGVRTPSALNLLRVRFFLHFHGYSVSELEVLQPAVFELCKCYVLGVYSLDEVKELISYSSATSIMTLFLSNPRLAGHKERRLTKALHRSEEDRKREISRVLKKHNCADMPQHSGAILELPPLTPEQAIVELRDLLQKIMPVVDTLTSLNLTNPELRRLWGSELDVLILRAMLLDLHDMIPQRNSWQKKRA